MNIEELTALIIEKLKEKVELSLKKSLLQRKIKDLMDDEVRVRKYIDGLSNEIKDKKTIIININKCRETIANTKKENIIKGVLGSLIIPTGYIFITKVIFEVPTFIVSIFLGTAASSFYAFTHYVIDNRSERKYLRENGLEETETWLQNNQAIYKKEIKKGSRDTIANISAQITKSTRELKAIEGLNDIKTAEIRELEKERNKLTDKLLIKKGNAKEQVIIAVQKVKSNLK